MMKRWILIISLLLATFIIIFTYVAKYSPEAKRAKINTINLKKLKPGMSLHEALSIMGKPDDVDDHPNYEGVKIYYYESPIGASSWNSIDVDSTNTLIQVDFSDE